MDNEFIIRLIEKRDIELARQLHNDDSTLFQLTDVTHVSECQQEKWFETVSLSNKSRRYSIFHANSGSFIGIFRLDNIDYINRNLCVGLDIVSEMRGRGFAKGIYKYFMDYYFLQHGFQRLYLTVLSDNKIALNLYSSLGFVEEGRQREAIFRNGKFIDLICMSVLSHEYIK